MMVGIHTLPAIHFGKSLDPPVKEGESDLLPQCRSVNLFTVFQGGKPQEYFYYLVVAVATLC